MAYFASRKYGPFAPVLSMSQWIAEKRGKNYTLLWHPQSASASTKSADHRCGHHPRAQSVRTAKQEFDRLELTACILVADALRNMPRPAKTVAPVAPALSPNRRAARACNADATLYSAAWTDEYIRANRELFNA